MIKSKAIKLTVTISLLIAVIVVGITGREHFNYQSLKEGIESFGVWAPLVFMLIYASAVVLLLPGAILTIAGGLLFGPVFGVVYSIVGAVLGATIAMLLGRYIAQDWVRSKMHGHIKHVIEGVEAEGWKFVAVIRLIPAIPFNVVNYVFGLTTIGLLPYTVTSFIFMLPGCIAYTYLGHLGEVAISGDTGDLVKKVSFGIGLLVVVGCIPWLVKKYRETDDKE